MRILLFACVCLLLSKVASAFTITLDEMQYGKEVGHTFSYEFAIEALTANGVLSYKGVTSYTVDSLSEDQVTLTSRGGLQEFIKPKGNSSSIPTFPRPMVPNGLLLPLANSDFKGRVQGTSKITLSRKGQLLSIEGENHLPFLLGNVSSIPFELLPSGDEKKWASDSSAAINSPNQTPYRPFGFHGSFVRPFVDQGQKKMTLANESCKFAIENKDDSFLVVNKTYSLKSAAKSDNESIELFGQGKWIYNLAERIPESLDLEAKFIQHEDGITVTVPIKLKFIRLPPEVLAKRVEEAQQKAMAIKELADRPITPEERNEILEAIQNGTQIQATKALEKLATRNPQVIDSDIAKAVENATKSSLPAVVHFAERALPKWSPEFNRRYEINKMYKGPLHVPSTGKAVDAYSSLFTGQIVQMQEHGTVWQAAIIQRLLADDKVEVGFLMGGKPVRSLTLSRRNIQLAPDEVDQPSRPENWPEKNEKEFESELREWVDSTGRHKLNARFVRLADGQVFLQTDRGNERRIPLERLSEKDQSFVKQAEEKNDNPFVPTDNPFLP